MPGRAQGSRSTDKRMPKSIWNGTISFGLAHVPIKLYSATESKTVSFREVHLSDGAAIEPIFVEKTYFVGCRDDGDAYKVFQEALEESGRVGIGRFTFHDREYLAAVRPLDGVLALHTLRFHDEIVDAGDLEVTIPRKGPSQQEVKMAEQLVESLHEEFDPTDYEDTYREAVLDLIDRKAKGKKIERVEFEEREETDDLAAALEASLKGRKS